MPDTATQYRDTLKNIQTSFSGETAPLAGEYYEHLYSQEDPSTGIPTLGVTRHIQQLETPSSQINYQQESLQSQGNNLTDMQILERVRSGQQVNSGSQNINNTHTLNAQTSNDGRYQQRDNQKNGSRETQQYIQKVNTNADTTTPNSFPLSGIFTLVFLLALVGFVYFIIRMWQDHQAQKLVMMKIHNTDSTQKKTPVTTSTKPEVTQDPSATASKSEAIQQIPKIAQESWRTEIEQANAKLMVLLNSKQIEGETVSDKLKAIKPGQFALADLAWEAQQGAKKLLTEHNEDVQEADIKRTLQFFTQVFAEHDV